LLVDIKQSFRRFIGRKNKTIVFKHENEKVQRRYFLKLISKIYLKINDIPNESVAKKIKNSIDKSIKITHIKSNQLQQQLKIKVTIEDNYAVVFKLTASNSILVSYLKNYFKDHLIKYRLKNYTVTLYPNSEVTAKLLEKLLNQKELIGCYVDFNYDINDFLTYKKTLMQKSIRRKNFSALFSILQEYYEILNCKADDDFMTVRKNYLKLVKQYHPDTLGNKDTSLIAYYSKKFQAVQEAYELLKIHFDNEKIA